MPHRDVIGRIFENFEFISLCFLEFLGLSERELYQIHHYTHETALSVNVLFSN